MAIKGNDSSVAVIKERVLFTGPVLVNVVACNPDLAGLTALGYNFEKDPEYVTDAEAGHKKVRLDFYVQQGEFKNKVSFFLEAILRPESKNTPGNVEFVNNYGQSTWAASVEEAVEKVGKNGNKWFKPEGARRAVAGETDLYTFIKDWANLDPTKPECTLEDLKAIFKGNFKEFQQIVKDLKSNQVWVMATVNEKGYQNVSNKVFGRATSKQFPTQFAKYVADQAKGSYPFKDNWSVEFKEYVPVVVTPDSDPAPVTTAANTADIF